MPLFARKVKEPFDMARNRRIENRVMAGVFGSFAILCAVVYAQSPPDDPARSAKPIVQPKRQFILGDWEEGYTEGNNGKMGSPRTFRQGTLVELDSCPNTWCKVRIDGTPFFLPKDAVLVYGKELAR